MSETFMVVAFKTETLTCDAFIKVALALLMLRSDTLVGPKVRYPVKLVPIVIPSDATIVLTVKVEELRTDAFVVPSMVVEELADPSNNEPVELGPTRIDPVVTFVPTDNSDPAFMLFTVKVETFSTDAFVIPSMVVEELVEPTTTFPVKFGPTVMVPFDKLGPMDNSNLPANKEFTVAADAFTRDAFIVDAFNNETFTMSAFNTEAFNKEEFKRVV